MREQLAKLSRGHDLAKAFSLARMRIALIFGLLKAHELQQYNKILTFHVNSLPSFVLGPRTGGHGGPSDQDRLLCGATNDGRSIPLFGCTLDLSLLQTIAASSLPFRSAEFEPARQRF